MALAATGALSGGGNPDLPPQFAQDQDGATYLRLRDEYVARIRGIDPAAAFDPSWRRAALETRFRQERAAKSSTTWTPIGPDTVSNGNSLQGTDIAVSGRVTAIAIDPTNHLIVYLGTAQGGVWRSLDGGASWTPIFDSAQ